MRGLDYYLPAMAMLFIQFIYAGMSLGTRTVLLQGMSPRVFIVYRQAFATIVIAPVAYFSGRMSGSYSLNLRSFSLIFLTSLIGLNTEFITTVQQRGAAIIKARKLSSALSAASAACDHIRDWVLGTPKGTWVSMGVYSDGSYGIQPGLIYSFPVTCAKGDWNIVQGLKINEFSREKMDKTAQELIEEKTLAKSCLN